MRWWLRRAKTGREGEIWDKIVGAKGLSGGERDFASGSVGVCTLNANGDTEGREVVGDDYDVGVVVSWIYHSLSRAVISDGMTLSRHRLSSLPWPKSAAAGYSGRGFG